MLLPFGEISNIFKQSSNLCLETRCWNTRDVECLTYDSTGHYAWHSSKRLDVLSVLDNQMSCNQLKLYLCDLGLTPWRGVALIYYRKLQQINSRAQSFIESSQSPWWRTRFIQKDPRSPKCVRTFICKVKRLFLRTYRYWEGIFADTVLVSPRLAQYLLRNHPTHTSDHRDAMCPRLVGWKL